MTPKVRQKLSGLFYPCAADDDEFIAVVALVAKATHSSEILDADKVGLRGKTMCLQELTGCSHE